MLYFGLRHISYFIFYYRQIFKYLSFHYGLHRYLPIYCYFHILVIYLIINRELLPAVVLANILNELNPFMVFRFIMKPLGPRYGKIPEEKWMP